MFRSFTKLIPASGMLLAFLTFSSAMFGGEDAAKSSEPVELVVYSGRSESLIGPALARYTKATGNPVKVKYGSTSGMTALLLEEGDNTPADLFIAQDAGALAGRRIAVFWELTKPSGGT